MAYSDNFPAVRPVFQADFANGGKIDPRATFSRPDSPINGSNAPASAVHYWSNEKHLSSENLVAQSSDLGSWSKGAVDYLSLTSNATTAPDGTTTAAQLTGLTGTNKKAIYYPVTAGSGSHTGIFYVKPNGHEYVQIMFGGVTTVYQNYHLSGIGTLGNGNNDGSSITQMGDWYKITLTSSSLSSATNYYLVLVDNNTASRYQDSTSTSSVYAWGANLSSTGEKVFNATTTQIHREYAPTLKSVSTAGQPRFEYGIDGQSAGTSLGCLIEGQSTNLATYGSDLTNAAWNPLSAFIGGTAVGPDGTLSAVKLVASAGSGLYPRFRRLSFLTDTTQTFSIYVKPLEFQHLVISADGSASCLVQYNLSGSGAITSATGATGAVEQCGNGWFRVSFSYTTVPNAHLAIAMQSSTTYQTETGNGYDGMLFALAQLENQSFSSSFIGTTSSTATRAADSLSVATADIGYTGGPVTIVSETEGGKGNYPRAFAISDGTANNRLVVYRNSAAASDSTDWYSYAVSDGSAQVSSTITSSAAAGKLAVSFDTNDVSTCAVGGTVTTDTSAVIPSGITTLYIGDDSFVGLQLNGHYKRIALYNEALSDTNLQALTS